MSHQRDSQSTMTPTELAQYQEDEKVYTRQAMDDKYGLGDYDEWEFKCLLRFDGRPDGIKDYLSHDLFKLTKPEWLDFLNSAKYELLNDDPTMIWEDTESHETWVLFDPRFLQTGAHLNKTENPMTTHSVRIRLPPRAANQSTGKGRIISIGTHSCLTRLEAAIKEVVQHFRVPKSYVVKVLAVDEEDGNFGCYTLEHTNQRYYVYVYREEKS